MPYKNREDALSYGKWYRKTYREKDLLSKARWRNNNKDKQNKLVSDWAKNNKERIKKNNAARYKRDKERITKRNKEYREKYPERTIAIVHKRRTAKTKAGGAYTYVQWVALCNKYNNKCLCCGKRRKLTADHVIPVSKGGTSNIDNIQPLCGPCNSEKHIQTTDFRR